MSAIRGHFYPEAEHGGGVPPLEILPWARIQGDRAFRGRETVPLAHLWPALEAALDRHGKALLWDLDGIEANRPRLDLLRPFEGMGLWVDAGVRRSETVIDVLVAGADRAVVGTKCLWDLEELENAFALTENVLLQIDYDGRVLHPGYAETPPTPESLASWIREHGRDTLLLLAPAGPPPAEALRPLLASVRVYVGIVGAETVPAWAAAGAAGAIIDLWGAVASPS
jgi:hypothetical protein